MQEERVKERERQEELAAVQDWRQMQSMGCEYVVLDVV